MPTETPGYSVSFAHNPKRYGTAYALFIEHSGTVLHCPELHLNGLLLESARHIT